MIHFLTIWFLQWNCDTNNKKYSATFCCCSKFNILHLIKYLNTIHLYANLYAATFMKSREEYCRQFIQKSNVYSPNMLTQTGVKKRRQDTLHSSNVTSWRFLLTTICNKIPSHNLKDTLVIIIFKVYYTDLQYTFLSGIEWDLLNGTLFWLKSELEASSSAWAIWNASRRSHSSWDMSSGFGLAEKMRKIVKI